MKSIAPQNIGFTASTQTLNFAPISNFNVNKLYAVINVTKSQIIYTIGTPQYSYSALNGTLMTLVYNTTLMSNTDVLTVLYDYIGANTIANSSPVTIASDQVVNTNLSSLSYPFSLTNNSTTQLASGASFIGTLETVLNLQAAQLGIICEQPYAVYVDQFIDPAGAQLISTDVYTRLANQPVNENITLPGNYFRLRVTNNGFVTTTGLTITTTFGIMATSPRANTNLGNFPTAINEIGGTVLTTGQKSSALSIPVTLSNENVLDLYLTGQTSQTAIINNILPVIASANSTDVQAYRSFTSQIISTGTGGSFIFEGSNDNINFQPIPVFNQGLTNPIIILSAITATVSQNIYLGACEFRYIRLRIVSTITGGSIQAFSEFSQTPLSASFAIVSQGGIINTNINSDILANGTITTADIVVSPPLGDGVFKSGTSTAGSYVSLQNTGGMSDWVLGLAGTISGTYYFEGSIDSTDGINGNWIAVNGRQIGMINTNLSYSTTVASDYRGNISGIRWYRVRNVGGSGLNTSVIIRFGSRTGTVFLNSSLPTGTNLIGSVSISGTTTISGNISQGPQGTPTTAWYIKTVDTGGVNVGKVDVNGATRFYQADPNSTNVSKWSSKQYPYVELDPISLFYDGFSASLDTTNKWNTSVSNPPTATSGNLQFNAGTTANASSYLSTIFSFPVVASVFNRGGVLVTLPVGAETGSKAWWGFGIIAGAPTMAVPFSNAVVFEIKDTDGSLVGAVYSNSVRTAEITLSIPTQLSSPVLSTGRPNDGLLHRYAVNYRASKVWFEIDDVIVGSFVAPNPQIVDLPLTTGVFNGSSVLGSPRNITITTISMADTGRNSLQISDGVLPFRKATVSASGELSIKPSNLGKTTYSVNAVVVSAGSATDVLTIACSGTKTISITKIIISGKQTTAGQVLFNIIKRTSTNSGGTSATVTSIAHDSNDASPTAVVTNYSVNPAGLGTTLGTGIVRGINMLIPATATAVTSVQEINFGQNSKPIVLRGTSQLLAINLNGVTVTGPSINIDIEFTEE